MEQPPIERVIEEVRRIYQEVSGYTAPNAGDMPIMIPFPPGVDPTTFLIMEYEQLKSMLAAQASTYAQPLRAPWYPAGEVFETPEHFCVHLDLPGVDKQAINCWIENNTLVVRGERKLASQADRVGATIQVMERLSGPFEKIILLPEYVRIDKVDARLTQGVLEIKIAKQAAIKPVASAGKKATQSRVEIKEG